MHGGAGTRAPHISNVGIPDADSASLVMALDLEGIAVSAGSACSSGAERAGPVIRALLGDEADRAAPLRFSLGRSTTARDVDRAAEVTAEVVGRLATTAGARVEA